MESFCYFYLNKWSKWFLIRKSDDSSSNRRVLLVFEVVTILIHLLTKHPAGMLKGLVGSKMEWRLEGNRPIENADTEQINASDRNDGQFLL